MNFQKKSVIFKYFQLSADFTKKFQGNAVLYSDFIFDWKFLKSSLDENSANKYALALSKYMAQG